MDALVTVFRAHKDRMCGAELGDTLDVDGRLFRITHLELAAGGFGQADQVVMAVEPFQQVCRL